MLVYAGPDLSPSPPAFQGASYTRSPSPSLRLSNHNVHDRSEAHFFGFPSRSFGHAKSYEGRGRCLFSLRVHSLSILQNPPTIICVWIVRRCLRRITIPAIGILLSYPVKKTKIPPSTIMSLIPRILREMVMDGNYALFPNCVR